MSSPGLEQKIGYFGRLHSFTHTAALLRFRDEENLLACPTVEGAFACLENQEVGRIIVPIENASSGIITNTADQLMRLARSGVHDQLRIREALTMSVDLVLMARDPAATITKLYSHRAPFDHSRDWLQRHYPDAKQIIVESTTDAALAAQGDPSAAAIGNPRAALEYNLKIVTTDVGADVPNQTTFIVVGLPFATDKPTHTNLVFELPHTAGSLVAVLEILAERSLNLTKILSRPIPGRFEEYRFMIEFAGAEPAPPVVEALARIRGITTFCAVMGAYPVRKI